MTETRGRQWSLRSTLGTVTIIVIATAGYRTHRQLVDARDRHQTLRQIVRELEVDDPQQVAVVAKRRTQPDDLVFEVWIPESQTETAGHRLCLALEDINGTVYPARSFPEPVGVTVLSPGRHRIEIQRDIAVDEPVPDRSKVRQRVSIVIDGEIAIEETRPPEWRYSRSYSSSQSISTSQSFAPEKRIELVRLRWNDDLPGGGSRSRDQGLNANGILVWIEPVK